MAALFGTAVGGSIDRVVRWFVLPITSVIPVLVRTGILWLAFALMWAGFLITVVVDPAALDAAWRAIGAMPLIGQALLWLLFLPVMAGLWTWATDWPLVVRLVLILALAAWNLIVFLPPRGTDSPSTEPREA
jgi:hypothetical protein